ncbi:DNA-binding protein [Muriicola sp. Z0-33]|uniref:DNA-binding protein n=1 Tax=Muriicola sp. Z0-33 TaxID=2816957 RepID=UPI0022381FA3|nr:DNA-binding protein [Muriicola sp. Z0-33]MCW5516702.1 DNA-binding protein [Muriicola sp. Z0-33]
MSSIKILERMQRLHSLISQECTGSPLELSRKLRISERSVYNLLDHLKDFNAEINYDRSRKTYYYQNDFKLEIQLSFSVITNNELTEILSGSYLSKKKDGYSTSTN